jgi:hypothetical protein
VALKVQHKGVDVLLNQDIRNMCKRDREYIYEPYYSRGLSLQTMCFECLQCWKKGLVPCLKVLWMSG